jgi:hypothetical protein
MGTTLGVSPVLWESVQEEGAAIDSGALIDAGEMFLSFRVHFLIVSS